MSKRKQLSPEQKASIVRRHVVEKGPICEEVKRSADADGSIKVRLPTEPVDKLSQHAAVD